MATKDSPSGNLDGIAMHRRIRRRRKEMGLAAYELADRVKISPSYVSLIEKGVKVPGEDVALRIAKALDDDPDLFLAWARTARYGDLETTLSGLSRLRQITSDPGLRDRVERGETLSGSDRAGAMPTAIEKTPTMGGDTPASEPSAFTLIQIPVLEEGADPGAEPAASGRVVDVVRIDSRMVPGPSPETLFAYRPGARGVERVRDRIASGDLVVLTTRAGPMASDRIHAVRMSGGVVLARVLSKGNALLVLPPDGSDEIDVIDVAEPGQLSGMIAGTVVMVVKWL